MKTASLIVAAGRGLRAGSAIPKQYMAVAGQPVLARTVAAFLQHPRIDLVQVVISPEDGALYSQSITARSTKLLPPVNGAQTRQGSVLSGLEALAEHGVAHVLVHDGARPFVSAEIISACCDALLDAPAAIAAVPISDTVKLVGEGGRIAQTLDRTRLWRAQTPQAFRFDRLFAAHLEAQKAGIMDFTDDAAVAEWAGIEAKIVPGSDRNRKITTPEDFTLAEQMLGGDSAPALPDIRTGQGFDVHTLGPGDHVWLCGVEIPHSQSLQGHSDADVGLHALTDALLGAIADGDIGEHFRNTDPRWRGAPSRLFLEDAAARVRARGGAITNADVTILCEAPKIAPHRTAMRAQVAEILGIDQSRVSVKATTTEGLGFTGRREGIAALATATVIFR